MVELEDIRRYSFYDTEIKILIVTLLLAGLHCYMGLPGTDAGSIFTKKNQPKYHHQKSITVNLQY